MIVLDDGWFGQRNNDRTSLGDWVVNLEKFPQGFKALVDDVNALGMKFGLWFEPEMVSEESVRIISCCLILFLPFHKFYIYRHSLLLILIGHSIFLVDRVK
jgi:hypothetical protein